MRFERTEEEKNVCRPVLPLPPAPVASGEALGRFLEVPNGGSAWKDDALMFAVGWDVLGPRMGEERSSPYAAGIGGGEEGRWRLSIVNGMERKGVALVVRYEDHLTGRAG